MKDAMAEKASNRSDRFPKATLPFVRELFHTSEIESTNNLAKDMLLRGTNELPLLVWADEQTLGRGRGDNRWWSDQGSLTFTIGLDPSRYGLRIDQELRLALMTAVAVIETIGALHLTAPGIGIRWPNDVEVNGRKLCGILPERVETREGRRLIIGVGLNVLTRIDQAPADIQGMATSLNELQPQPLEPSVLPQLLAGVLTRFEAELDRLAVDDPNLAERWNSLNLLLNQVVRISLGPRVVEGKVLEIDPQGALRVHDGQQVHQLFGGQVLRSHT
jgi:BirA family transcriptional regulator, biotin operon repressor / biotin---[acetyl-CoA-carboxylase] ligase